MIGSSNEYLKSHKIHMIGNAHIDPAWLWRWMDGFSEVKATFQSALDRLQETPGFVFTAAGACYYKWVEENCPAMFDEISRYIAQGRWIPVNGWWIQPDCNIPCGESFARHSLYSQRYYLEKFGLICDTGYNVDSFGHSGMLPQILIKSGMTHYVFMRPGDHEKPGLPNIFQWESNDGSRVLTYKIPFSYVHTDAGTLNEKIVSMISLGTSQDTDMMLFYGVGNHGGGPTIALLDEIDRLQQIYGRESLTYSSPSRFMAEIERESDKYAVVHDELQIHAIGCYSAMLGIKQLNRHAENRLLCAERFSALSHSLLNSPVKTRELAAAWEKVLFNQFHDIICGCSMKTVYDDARELYGYSLCVAGEILNDAVQRISWSVDTMGDDSPPRIKEAGTWLWGGGEKGSPVIVFNPLPFDVVIPVEVNSALAAISDAENTLLPIQRVRSLVIDFENKWNTVFIARLPALGYCTYWLHKAASVNSSVYDSLSYVSVEEDGSRMANEFVEVLFDHENGCIAEIYDKKNNISVMNGLSAVGLVIDETDSDTWGHGLTEYRNVVGKFAKVSAAVLENGPLRCAIRITGGYHDSSLVQDFLLYHDRPEIEVRVKIHWKEQHKMLKLEFPVNITNGQSFAEIPYGTIERPMDGTEKPIQQWADVSSGTYGVSIINDSSHAVDVKDGTLRLTVLRSPIYADHFGKRDSSCEFMEQGEHEVKYMIYPHEGDWRQAGTSRKAMAFNTPMAIVYETYHKGPLPQKLSGLLVYPDNINVTAVKISEDNNGYILRCYETAGRATNADIELSMAGRKWNTQFGPGEIKTFFIPFEPDSGIEEVNLLEMKSL